MSEEWATRCARCGWESDIFDNEEDAQAAVLNHFLDVHPDVDITAARLRKPDPPNGQTQ